MFFLCKIQNIVSWRKGVHIVKIKGVVSFEPVGYLAKDKLSFSQRVKGVLIEDWSQWKFETVFLGKSAKDLRRKMPPRQDSRSGPHKRYEHFSTKEVNAYPSTVFNFHEVGCLEFCQKIQEVKSYLPLTHLFGLRLQ